MLLAIGSILVEAVPSIFKHILLLADGPLLSSMQQSSKMWFIAGVNDPAVINSPKYYDVCFDFDESKLYTSDTIMVRIDFRDMR